MFSSLSLNHIGICLRDGSFPSDIGIVNIYPSKRTHWVAYINESSFDSYGCSPPQKLSKITKKRNGHCFYSEYNISGLTSEKIPNALINVYK